MFFETAGIVSPVWLPLLWGVLVGLVFSTVGAAGGILASFGLISVIGIQDPNLVKPMAQALTLATPLIAVPGYYRQGRMVFSLALILGAGGILGALVGSSFSAAYLTDIDVFKSIFGMLTLAIALQVLSRTLGFRQKPGTRSARAAAAFEGLVHDGGSTRTIGVSHRHYSSQRIHFVFAGVQFEYAPWAAFLAGAGIAVVSSALGVGGGFLLVPFMVLVLGLPMFLVAGTAALAIAVSSITSIGNYLRLGVELDVPLLLLLLAGTIAGAWVGPRLSSHLRERWLEGILGLVLMLIGVRYLGSL
jgi:uncharacterized membrane protein YfcA